MIGLEAMDQARRAQMVAEAKAAARSSVGPDGEPADRPDEGTSEARMTAWRRWARRRELAHAAPGIKFAPPGGTADPAATGG